MNIRIDHPTDRPNFSRVEIGEQTFVFSYNTLVGFHSAQTGWLACKNTWGPTTGKHIHALMVPVDQRLDYEEFDRRVEMVLNPYLIKELALA